MTVDDDRFYRRSVIRAGAAAAAASFAGCSGLADSTNRDAGSGGATETVEVEVTATPTPGSGSMSDTDDEASSGDGDGDDEESGNAESAGGPAKHVDVSAVATDAGFTFEPAVVHVAASGSVTWEVQGGSHTVTSYHEDNDLPTRIPADATPWDSGPLGEGETFSHTFEAPGVYDYVCVPHKMMGMVGTVVVGEPDADGQPALEPPQSELSDAEREELDALEAAARELLSAEAATSDSHDDGESSMKTNEETECDPPADGAATASEGNVTNVTSEESTAVQGNVTGNETVEGAEPTPTPEEGGADQEVQGSAGAETHEVELVSRTFRPDVIRIAPGDAVTWTLVDGTHTVTAYDGSDGYPPRIPNGAEGWASGPLEAGESFSHTFEIPGVYDYFCKPHHGKPMVGSIVVGSPDPAGQPGLEPPAPDLDDDTRAAIERLNREARTMLEEGAGEASAAGDDGTEQETGDQPDADRDVAAQQEPSDDDAPCGGEDVVDVQSATFEGNIGIVFDPVEDALAPGSEATVVARYHGKRLAHAPVEVDTDDDDIVGATDACGEFRFTIPEGDSIRVEIRIDDARGRHEIALADG